MKKIFAVALLALATFTMNAQDFKKFRFGPTAGLNISTMNLDWDHSSRVGFNVGALVEYNFTKNFYVGSGLKFTQKGVKWNGIVNNIDDPDLKCNPYYLEIPLNAAYRYSFNDKLSVFGEVGPYFAFGVGGKYKNGDSSWGYFGDEGEDFMEMLTGEEIRAKRFDFGLGFAAGVEYAKFQLRVGYELGLTKAFNVDGSAKTRNLYVGLAYMF